MSNQLYTTAEAAQSLGISAGTVRSWLSRYPGAFQEGLHLEQVDGKRLWTEAGLALLRTRINAGEGATESAAQQVAGDVAPIPTTATPGDAPVTEPSGDPLQQFAEAIAWGMIEHQLPGAVQVSITRILTNPTELDQRRLLGILERVGCGVTLARMSAIFAGGLQQAIAASQDSLKALGGGSDEAG